MRKHENLYGRDLTKMTRKRTRSRKSKPKKLSRVKTKLRDIFLSYFNVIKVVFICQFIYYYYAKSMACNVFFSIYSKSNTQISYIRQARADKFTICIVKIKLKMFVTVKKKKCTVQKKTVSRHLIGLDLPTQTSMQKSL